jgi:uncharacterized DUF497 family protein
MTDPQIAELFASIRRFEWHAEKRLINLRLHKIDFADVPRILEGSVLVYRSDRNNETRYMIFGFLDEREVVVICTLRAETCRVISARRAKRYERKTYHSRLPRESEKGQD